MKSCKTTEVFETSVVLQNRRNVPLGDPRVVDPAKVFCHFLRGAQYFAEGFGERGKTGGLGKEFGAYARSSRFSICASALVGVEGHAPNYA